MNIRTRRIETLTFIVATLVLFAGAGAALASENSQQRVSGSVGGQGDNRSEMTLQELAPMITKGERSGSSRGGKLRSAAAANSKGGSTQSASANDFWIYDAIVELYADVDRDGYFSGIDLEFDADTIYNEAEVYAVLYLSLDYGPWNEYAVTDTFTIFGTSGDDEYFVETDLVSGYPTGDYDILVELFDTYDDAFVASYGPDESSELSFLPLEDIALDTPIGSTVTINQGGGGGAFGVFAILLLGLVAARRV